MKQIQLLLLLILFSFYAYGKNVHNTKKDSMLYVYIDSVQHFLDSLDVQETKYVLSQAIWESGWFKCKNCSWNNNNVFGFMGSDGKYMKFRDLRECIIFYSNWQKKRFPKYKLLYPTGSYLNFLIYSRYARSETYITHIQIIYNWLIKNYK